VKLVPPVVDQVSMLPKGALCLLTPRMVQRSKEAPEPAFLPDHLSGMNVGGDNRKYGLTYGRSPAIKRRHGERPD
jgi:hypothetical protein